MWRTLFTTLTATIDGPLLSTLDAHISSSITYVSTILVSLMAMAIAFYGLAIAAGISRAPASSVITLGAKLVLVLAFTSTSVYSYYVRDFIITAIPHDISQIVGGAPTSTAHSYDVSWNVALDAAWSTWSHLDWRDVGRELLVAIYIVIAAAACGFGYGIWLMGHIMAVVYVALGPVFVPLFLFSGTRRVFSAWCGCLLSCVVLQALSVALASILVNVEQNIVGGIVTDTTSDAQMLTGELLCGIILFGLCAWWSLKLPSAAAALCGGVHFSPYALSNATYGAVGSGARAIGRGARYGANRLVQESRANLGVGGPRLQPVSPPGPSMSRSGNP